jgi:phosphoribosyl-AMP cyclohydrolase
LHWEANALNPETVMDIDFRKLDGLVPAIIQDQQSARVLMLGFMNQEALRKTIETGAVTFYSRTRKKLWTKGESSGHRLRVVDIATDCDYDSLLVRVEALGPGVCHEGFAGCFFRSLRDGTWVETESRVFDPDKVYGGAK